MDLDLSWLRVINYFVSIIKNAPKIEWRRFIYWCFKRRELKLAYQYTFSYKTAMLIERTVGFKMLIGLQF